MLYKWVDMSGLVERPECGPADRCRPRRTAVVLSATGSIVSKTRSKQDKNFGDPLEHLAMSYDGHKRATRIPSALRK